MAGSDASEGQAVWQPGGAEEDSRLREGNRHLHLAYDEEEDSCRLGVGWETTPAAAVASVTSSLQGRLSPALSETIINTTTNNNDNDDNNKTNQKKKINDDNSVCVYSMYSAVRMTLVSNCAI